MRKVSEFLKALREVSGRYDWTIDGGNIVGQSRRRRSDRSPRIEPLVAVMRVITGRRVTRYNRNWCCYHDYTNIPDIHRASLRPGRRGHSTRQRWIRKLIIQQLGLGANDD